MRFRNTFDTRSVTISLVCEEVNELERRAAEYT
jgi:hypothetical protein